MRECQKVLYLDHIFLLYVSNLSDDLASYLKLFANNMSLLSVLQNITKLANDLNNDLAKIRT